MYSNFITTWVVIIPFLVCISVFENVDLRAVTSYNFALLTPKFGCIILGHNFMKDSCNMLNSEIYQTE